MQVFDFSQRANRKPAKVLCTIATAAVLPAAARAKQQPRHFGEDHRGIGMGFGAYQVIVMVVPGLYMDAIPNCSKFYGEASASLLCV